MTEPTPAGLNDVQRVVEVVRHFRIQLGIALNRADIHLESNLAIKQYARDKGFPILAEIPYDKRMPLALANAQPVASVSPAVPASIVISTLATTISEKINEIPE